MSTLREKYLEQIQLNYEEALDLAYLKSQDYATDGDPFKNFRNSKPFAGSTLEQGILVRIGDKFARYLNLFEKGALDGQSGEKLDDTLRDAMNYTNILLSWHQLGKPASDTVYEEQLALPLEDFPRTQENNPYENTSESGLSLGRNIEEVNISPGNPHETIRTDRGYVTSPVAEKPKDWIERLTGRTAPVSTVTKA